VEGCTSLYKSACDSRDSMDKSAISEFSGCTKLNQSDWCLYWYKQHRS